MYVKQQYSKIIIIIITTIKHQIFHALLRLISPFHLTTNGEYEQPIYWLKLFANYPYPLNYTTKMFCCSHQLLLKTFMN